MSTKEIINYVKKLSLPDKMIVMEELLIAMKTEASGFSQSGKSNNNLDIKARRRAFHIESFNLGQEIEVDRDEIYSDRGL